MVTVTILELTDIHSNGSFDYQALIEIVEEEGVDLVVVAGDLTTWGSPALVKQVLKEVAKIGKPVFYVPGNMDKKGSENIEFSNVSPLHKRVRNFSGFFFLGVGGSNETPFRCPFTLSEEEIEQILKDGRKKIPVEAPIVLVSHSPPKGSEADKVSFGVHVGSRAVRNFVEDEEPVAILCGHLHESRSISRIKRTLCINPGPAAHGNGAILELGRDAQGDITAKGKLIKF